MTKKILIGVWIFCGVLALFLLISSASVNHYLANAIGAKIGDGQYALGTVLAVQGPPETLSMQILSGIDRGEVVQVPNDNSYLGDPYNASFQPAEKGEVLVLIHTASSPSIYNGPAYYPYDRFRASSLLAILFVFIAAVIVFGKMRGLTALVGLGSGALILVFFILPALLQGTHPILAIISGVCLIAIVSLYLAHGFSKRTSIAILGTVITVFFAAGITFVLSSTTRVVGVGPTDQAFLQFTGYPKLSLSSLFFATILLGTIGILDDVTIGQATAMDEIRKANPRLGFQELYKRGSVVGREHIASLVNTLILVYVSVALPFLIEQRSLIGGTNALYWVIASSESVMEEILRTVVGSVALLLAVPITTFLAAYFFGKEKSG